MQAQTCTIEKKAKHSLLSLDQKIFKSDPSEIGAWGNDPPWQKLPQLLPQKRGTTVRVKKSVHVHVHKADVSSIVSKCIERRFSLLQSNRPALKQIESTALNLVKELPALQAVDLPFIRHPKGAMQKQDDLFSQYCTRLQRQQEKRRKRDGRHLNRGRTRGLPRCFNS